VFSLSPRASHLLRRAGEALSRPFTLSLASVTAFRLLLSFAVLYDLLRWRLPWFAVWYTDGGLFRGDEVYRLIPPVFPFFFGHPLLSHLLFALLVLAALLFGLGYRPRAMALLAGVLLLALDARNPWLLNTGHVLMPAFLFLSVLLPLEGSWGVGAALFRGPVPEAVRTPVLLPFLLLAFTAYFLNAVAKDFEAHFARADAVANALISYGTVLGVLFAERFPEVLPWLSRYTWLVEAGVPFLLLLPLWPLRLLGVGLLMSLHLGFLLFLDIGNFPLVMLAFLALFVPPEAWRLLGGFWERLRGEAKAVVHYDGGCGFCARISEVLVRLLLARAEVRPAEGEALALLEARRSWVVELGGRYYLEGRGFQALLLASPFRPLALLWGLPGFARLADRAYRLVADRRPSLAWTRAHLPALAFRPPGRLQVALALLFSLAYGAYSFYGPWDYGKAPETLAGSLGVLGLDLRWGHFSPKPNEHSLWIGAVGVTFTGRTVDPWRALVGLAPEYRPEEVPRFPVLLSGGEHWRKVWWGADPQRPSGELRVRGFARYLCRFWNGRRAPTDWIAGVTLYRYWARPGWERPRRALLAHVPCPVEGRSLEVEP
jgi:predicted DCC family thiol-disulfide oxidoreductase YuxK